MLDDRSRAVFNGKSSSTGAQKTDAKPDQPDLLLSDRAKVDTKPQLEIFADDVSAPMGHGGIPRSMARLPSEPRCAAGGGPEDSDLRIRG